MQKQNITDAINQVKKIKSKLNTLKLSEADYNPRNKPLLEILVKLVFSEFISILFCNIQIQKWPDRAKNTEATRMFP